MLYHYFLQYSLAHKRYLKWYLKETFFINLIYLQSCKCVLHINEKGTCMFHAKVGPNGVELSWNSWSFQGDWAEFLFKTELHLRSFQGVEGVTRTLHTTKNQIIKMPISLYNINILACVSKEIWFIKINWISKGIMKQNRTNTHFKFLHLLEHVLSLLHQFVKFLIFLIELSYCPYLVFMHWQQFLCIVLCKGNW